MSAPTKQEVSELLKGWAVLERLRGRDRLKAEISLLRELRSTLRFQVQDLSIRLEGTTDSNKALYLIRQASDRIDDAIAATVTVGRGNARDLSLAAAEREVDRLRSLLTKDGWEGAALPPAPIPADRTIDVPASANVGASVASRWGTAALASVLRWEASPETSLPHAIRSTATALAPQLETVAATEISSAFYAEQLEALEPLSDYPWSAQIFKVWSAMLDGSTCQRCFEMDGRAVPTDVAWPEGASQPLHPRCRCMTVPLYIPKPRALQDVATDYGSYKQEIRDQIRESRGVRSFDRPAAEFVSRSRASRSPIVISKDFAIGKLSR